MVAVDVYDGIQKTAPVVELNDRPVGNVGEMLYDNGVVPPPPVTGVNEAAWLCVRTVTAIACVAVTAGLTVRMNVLLAVAELASVTVTVYVVAVDVAVGVPTIGRPLWNIKRQTRVGKLKGDTVCHVESVPPLHR